MVKELLRQQGLNEDIEEGVESAGSSGQLTFATSSGSGKTGTNTNHSIKKEGKPVPTASNSVPATQKGRIKHRRGKMIATRTYSQETPGGMINEWRWSAEGSSPDSPNARVQQRIWRQDTNVASASSSSVQREPLAQKEKKQTAQAKRIRSPPRRPPLRRNRLKKIGVPFQNLSNRALEIRVELKPTELEKLLGGGKRK